MPNVIFTRAVVLVLFYIYTGCSCLVIPYHDNAEVADIIPRPSERTIKMCGTKLTSIIMSICNGYIISPSESMFSEIIVQYSKALTSSKADNFILGKISI